MRSSDCIELVWIWWAILSTNLHNLKCFDSTSMWYMWTTTQINKRSASIYGGASTVGDLIPYDVLFVFIAFKHFQKIILRHDQTLEWLFLLDYLTGDGLQWLPV